MTSSTRSRSTIATVVVPRPSNNGQDHDEDPLDKVRSAKLTRELLDRHFADLFAFANLSISTALVWLTTRAIHSPSLFTFWLGVPASEFSHILLGGQFLNLLALYRRAPHLFHNGVGRFFMLVNAWSAVKIFRSLWDVLNSPKIFAVALAKQGNIPNKLAQTGRLPGLLGLVPLFIATRGGKSLTFTRNVPYADLSVVDPRLLALWKATPTVLRNMNAAFLRGRFSSWLNLDVVVSDPLPPPGSPVLMYIHGGAWAFGDKLFAGMALINRVASSGVVVFTINYRMSPDVVFPAHIQDCKRALIWIKKNCAKWNGDPNKVFVSGESAGGHLSALTGCTMNYPLFQPPEEPTGDTSVRGALPIYGVFDWCDTDGHLNRIRASVFDLHIGVRPFVSRAVIQKPFKGNEQEFREASPTYHIRRALEDDANPPLKVPPYLIPHGTLDALAAYNDSLTFFTELRKLRAKQKDERTKDILVTVEGGLHGFGYLPSVRANAMGDAFVEFIRYHSAR